MEIKYTNFELDPKVYGTNEITALIDPDGTYLYENIYGIRTFSPSTKLPIRFYLRLNTDVKTRKLVFDMLSELEINRELEKRPLNKLSSTEKLKVLIIKLCTTRAKNIILESLDTYFNYKDMMQVIKCLKNHLLDIDKNVIITANKVDNLLQYADRYLVIKDRQIYYNGKDFTEITEPTDIKMFTELANAKGAKLKDYKEPNDLLKAIYRSVEKK